MSKPILTKDGQHIGAIGINGATPELDGICAEAALDAAERNVIVDKGRISGIVDIDEMFFGDPLFVIGLTYAALEKDGYDTVYPDAWVELLQLDNKAHLRVFFYRLFYTALFMRQYCRG